MNFSTIDDVKARLDEYVEVRDKAITRSRTIVSLSRSLIQNLHQIQKEGSKSTWRPSIETAKERLLDEFRKVQDLMGQDPRLKHAGFWRNAMQELTEAVVLTSIIVPLYTGGDITFPSPKEIGVTDKAFILGLCDVSGELKRATLQELKDEQFELVTKLLTIMEGIYHKLMLFDYPHSVLPGFKKKLDILRRVSLSTSETLVKIKKETELREALEKVGYTRKE